MRTRARPFSAGSLSLVWALLGGCHGDPLAPGTLEITPQPGVEGFAARLDSIRVRLRVPGMAAALAHNGRVVWSVGLGEADAETGRAATPGTPFHLASLTKPFGSLVVMQLVEEGLVDLEDPVREYGIFLSSPDTIRVRHLLTHTSEGVPGSAYRYNGGRFANLDQVISIASGRSFGEVLVDRVLSPLGLRDTAPNPARPDAFALTGLDLQDFKGRMAAGYEPRGSTVVPREHPDYFGTAAGLVASAEDVATFSLAVDEGRFLTAETWRQVFSPAISNAGDPLPYGLGWFIHQHQGITLQWHYGYWTTNSSLIVRVPEERLTFVVLANTPGLSAAYPGLGTDSNVLRSDVARLFVEAFVTGDEPLPGGS